MRSFEVRNDFLPNYALGCGACLLRDLVFFGAVGFRRTAPGDRSDSGGAFAGLRADELRTIRLGSLSFQARQQRSQRKAAKKSRSNLATAVTLPHSKQLVRESRQASGFLDFNDPTSANDLLDDLFATDAAEVNIDFLGRRENVATVVVA